MATRHIYYQLKPYLPARLRMAMRRLRAKVQRHLYRQVWPIDEGAGMAPAGWPGWPGGAQFALVLTHDVEGLRGLSRVRPLAELESSLGLVSAFNFIPEGEYSVSKEFRSWLTSQGFEVGVHDLRHDGKLLRSHREFRQHAARINRYLEEWDAQGFRAGFMLHQLDWFDELDIIYDASTFDTDPFEPQPDGVGTIFPFWVVGRSGKGYVELPYTIPQDGTLFNLLGETSIAIWKRKLDWVAERGGMVLINTHPDYLYFPDETPSWLEHPSWYYEAFLHDILDRYRGRYWHALPTDVALYFKNQVVALAGEGAPAGTLFPK